MDLTNARTKFTDDLALALEQARTSPSKKKPIVLVTAPCGLGKTRTSVHLLRYLRLIWFAPRNEAQQEVEGFLDNPLPDVAPLQGAGDFRPIVGKRIARDDDGACARHDRLDPVVDSGLGRFAEQLACRGCPARENCAYQNWKPAAPWLFAAHARLGLMTNDASLFVDRDFIVIDETPLTTILSGSVLQTHELQLVFDRICSGAFVGRGQVAAEAFKTILETVLDVIARPPPGRRRVALAELVSELGYQFVSHFSSLPNLLRSQPRDARCTQVDPNSVREMLGGLKLAKDLAEKVHELADALADDRGARPACVLVLPHDRMGGAIVAGHYRDPRLPDSVPLVILDATTEPLLYSMLFDRPIIRVTADVDQSSPIFQTVDHRYPAATLEDPKSPSLGRVMSIVDEYKKEHPSEAVALIIKKGTYDEPLLKKRIHQTFAAADVYVFWGVRGTNALVKYDAVFVVGAPELPPFEAEAQVRAFMSRMKLDPKDVVFDYSATTFRITGYGAWRVDDRNGQPATVEERCYVGTFEAFVWKVFHQDEYVQAILRARPYDPATKKNVFFLSNLVLGGLETILVREADLLGEDLLVRARAIVEAGGAGWTQRALARELEVSESALSKNKKKNPRYWSDHVAPYLLARP